MKPAAVFLVLVLAPGCHAAHVEPESTPSCPERAFAPLREHCPGYAEDLCRTCPDAEDRFYAAAERLGCGCPSSRAARGGPSTQRQRCTKARSRART